MRAAAKEQVASLGAKFLEIEVDSKEAEGAGGYARAVSEEFLARQRAAMLKAVSDSDVVITTAGVPGKKAPILVTRAMVEAMHPGSVVVDLMAENGGNCEVTKPGETVTVGGASVLGPTNVVSQLGGHASQMFSRNLLNFLKLIVKKGELVLDTKDEIVREVLVAQGGDVVQPRGRDAPIPGHAGSIVDQREFLSRQPIEKRRFSDIRPPDDHDREPCRSRTLVRPLFHL